MESIIDAARRVLQHKEVAPFSIYSSLKEQDILNVPIIKPLLILVLEGSKELGRAADISCASGSFIFLSNNPNIDMRNIPSDREYFALLIEFEFDDFDCFTQKRTATESHFQGQLDTILTKTVLQFIEWSAYAPENMWPVRRREILLMLQEQGYDDVCAIMEPPSISHKLHRLIGADLSKDLGADALAAELAMSESTMRRKLNAEGTNLQLIKDRVKLGYGLHMVQSGLQPIGRIAEQCGYLSQSRFTDRFKQLFGMTPTELRKTRMPE
jgi:AraC-like DNA-binding protein